jgi:hypothetical protein
MELFPLATFVAVAGSATFISTSADHALTNLGLFVQERVISRQLEHLEKVQLQQRACVKPSVLQVEEANKTTESVRSLMRQLLYLLTAKVRSDNDKQQVKPVDIPSTAWILALKLRQSTLYNAGKYTLESWARLFESEITPQAQAALVNCSTPKDHNRLVDSVTIDELKSWLLRPHSGQSLNTAQKIGLLGDLPGEAYLNLYKLSGISTLFLVVEPKFCCFYP